MANKTPKSQLKELEDQNKVFGAKLVVIDSTRLNNELMLKGHFEFTCKFNKTSNGPILEGVGSGASKKMAEHAACQKVLDMLKNQTGNVSELETGLHQVRVNPASVPVLNAVTPTRCQMVIDMQQRQPLFNNGDTYVIQSNSKPRNAGSSLSQVTTIPADESQLDPPEMLKKAMATNVIGELQEFCVKNKLTSPEYLDVQWTGPDNAMRFKVTSKVGVVSKYGVATVKITAKKIAAFKVLEEIRNQSPTSTTTTVIASTSHRNINIPSTIASVVEQPSSSGTATARPTVKITEKIIYYPSNKIGSGGTATVFEGYYEKPTRKAAVKICKKEFIHHEKNKELDIMRKLNDPNVVTYFITEDINDLTYIVMELAINSLEDVILKSRQNEPLPLKKWSSDVTKGLVALHNFNVVHRDLKPSNVLICQGDIAKLADFGISKELDSCTQGVVTEAARGTRIWMPPEGLNAIGSNVPFVLLKTFDIFSLGLTIFFTMTKGKHLFALRNNEGPIQIMSNIVEYRPNWSWIADNEWTSLKNLLQALICNDHTQRPDASIALEHPFFWDDRRGLDFVFAVNTDLKNTQNTSATGECKSEMSKMYARFCNEATLVLNWRSRLCSDVQDFMKFKDNMRSQKQGNVLQLKKYNESSFLKLIDFIRDYYQHYDEWNKFEGGRLRHENVFGVDGSNYGKYFLNRFPELTTILYVLFQERTYHGLQLPDFYRLNKMQCFPKW